MPKPKFPAKSKMDPAAGQIFVKAKTGEKMGKIGRSEAIEVWATCLLSK